MTLMLPGSIEEEQLELIAKDDREWQTWNFFNLSLVISVYTKGKIIVYGIFRVKYFLVFHLFPGRKIRGLCRLLDLNEELEEETLPSEGVDLHPLDKLSVSNSL